MELVFDEGTYKAIWAEAMKDSRFRPYHIYFEPPYEDVAFWLEHGTGPAQKREAAREDGKTAKERIGDWTKMRHPGLSKKKLEKKKDDMYDQIMQTGTPPHPFIRPAAEDLYANGHAEKILAHGGSTEDLAQELVNLMVDYLRANGSVTGKEGDDSIEKHIVAEPFRDETVERPDISTAEEIFRDWETLDHLMWSKHAQNMAAYRSRKEDKR